MTIALKRKMFGPTDPRGPTRGKDVAIAKFGLHHYDPVLLPKPEAGFSEDYGQLMEDAVKVLQRHKGFTRTGNIADEPTWDVIWTYLDAYRKYRYRLFRVPTPPPPPLIEPIQGFNSLTRELWEDYSLARRMGLSDLGTYNPDSRLPSGAPSDHAMWPAFAFDAGVSPQTGWENETGRAFFNSMAGRPEVSYCILGDKIWSIERGLHAYTGGGHDNHCHVSGRH